MALFNLKFAIMYFQDGYLLTGAINLMAGYAAGVTTIAVDTFTGAVAVGDPFTIAGDTSNTTYTVVSHTETLGNTTSITFTPALGHAVTDDAVVTVGPHVVEAVLGSGNLNIDEKRKREYIMDRGYLSSVRDGDDEPIEVSFDCQWIFLKGASAAETPYPDEILKNQGNAANWITSASDPCEPYAIDIILKYIPQCPGVDMEWITIPDFRYESLKHDAKTGMIACTGKSFATQMTSVRLPTTYVAP